MFIVLLTILRGCGFRQSAEKADINLANVREQKPLIMLIFVALME